MDTSFTLKLVKTKPEATLPSRATAEATGYDLYAAEECVIFPGERKLVSAGFKMQIVADSNKKYYAQLKSRSGLAVKNCVDVGAGVIDSDYRGEVKVLLINNSSMVVDSVQKPIDDLWTKTNDYLILRTQGNVSIPEETFMKSLLEKKQEFTLYAGKKVQLESYEEGKLTCTAVEVPGTFHVKPGDRIAQMVILEYFAPAIEEVTELTDTARGEGGFGSTGK